MPNYQKFFSETALARRPSPIRVLTAIQMASGPDMISLAGGMPNPSKFPIDSIAIGVSGKNLQMSDTMLAKGLQYAPSRGLPMFVEQLNGIRREYHGKSELESEIDSCVSVGSQNGLEMLLQTIISPGDGIFVDDPIYPGTKAILKPIGANMVAIDTDEDGMDTDSLETKIRECHGKMPLKAIMTVANGGNPTGSTLSLERRKRLLELADEFDLLVIEDDPYYFLQFEGCDFPSLFSLDWCSDKPLKRVIRSDSFSKVISAGIRVGWITGPKEVISKMELAAQASIMHTPALIQVICSTLLTEWGQEGFHEHILDVRKFYKSQRDTIVTAASTHLSEVAEWHTPKAGLFLWLKLKGITDTSALIEEKARQANVLLCPGNYFAVNEGKPNPYCRAAFSLATPDEMNEAFKRLAELIRSNQS